MLPSSSWEYENPTPSGCDRNSMLDASVKEYGLRYEVRFLEIRQGPSSVSVSREL